ncbi:helicase [Bifidobacterium aquikefiricola]|uniref:Helicase n=1 Tax=Bifidobacterium aquikefiricola TaxID=3059038 RepID=A0AB39U5U2_9BIFI
MSEEPANASLRQARGKEGNILDSIRAWRREYQNEVGQTPLEDISQLAARLDLTHAHPSGIAQLFAGGQTHLDSLFRDNGVLRAAIQRMGRVLEDQTAKNRLSGCAELSLVVGVATWLGSSMPVLLYPIEVEAPQGARAKMTIRISGPVEINGALISALREHGVDINAKRLFNELHFQGGTAETSALFNHIENETNDEIADFTIAHDIILGCLVEPSTLLLNESQNIIDELADGSSGNTVLDAIAGQSDAVELLKNQPMADFSPFDADPHDELEIADVDNHVRFAAHLAASGRSIFMNESSLKHTATHAAAVASRCIMNGRTVLYVPSVADQKRRFTQVMIANDMEDMVLDVADGSTNAIIDRQLIDAVGYQQGTAGSHFDQLADELVGVRSRLTRYLGDLHGVNERWNVSAYQTIQNLAHIAALPTHPTTRVRLDINAARTIGPNIGKWASLLERAADIGEFTIGPKDTVWYKASISSENDAVDAYQRVVRLLERTLPSIRQQVANTVQTCGFPVPATAHDWENQVTVLKNLRRVLDIFQPEIFERDIASMIEATKPKAERKANGTTMGFWERRRHTKEAKGLLRVGAQVDNLHDALIVVSKQAEQWRIFVPHGGWPVLPPRLDQIMETQDSLSTDLTALNTVLATTPQGAELESVTLNSLEERLKALFSDHLALETLPERCRLEEDFDKVGLGDLVRDLHSRRVESKAVRAELQLAWWTTVFEDIVRSSEMISNQDGSALSSAADRFVQIDTEHVRSVGAMLNQELTKRLSEMLFSHTQEANQLHTRLSGSQRVGVDVLHRDFPRLISAAKPIFVATPATLAALTGTDQLADMAIVDAAAHMPSIELLTIAKRVKQIVILGHRETVTSNSVKRLISLLPSIDIPGTPDRRPQDVSAFLKVQGYGSSIPDGICPTAQGTVKYKRIEATGVPVMATGLVESSQQEIDAVVGELRQRARSFTIVPASYVLTIVTLSPTHRNRLGAELKSCAIKDPNFAKFLRHVRIIGIDEIAGAQSGDVIISFGFAKTSHGRLLQQFGELEGEAGKGMLLDALALSSRNLDIISAFGSDDMEDDRIHQPGPRFLKVVLQWAENLDKERIKPVAHDTPSPDMLLDDLADRIRKRGLDVALYYGYAQGARIPLVVGVKGKPFALAVLTDNADYMRIRSTRQRHRFIHESLQMLGWSVITVWSVAAFVNPDKEVDRIVSQLAEVYGDTE